MPRQPRTDEAGMICHALNRGNRRQTIFQDRPKTPAPWYVPQSGKSRQKGQRSAFIEGLYIPSLQEHSHGDRNQKS